MKKIKRFFYHNFIFCTLLVLFLGIVIGSVSTYSFNKGSSSSLNKLLSTKEEITLNEGARIKEIIYYKKANKEEVSERKLDEKYVGLTKKQFQKKNSNYEIISFSENFISIKKEIDFYPLGYYKISVMEVEGEEYVAAFSFNEKGETKLLEVSSFPVSLLDEETIKELKNGIIIENESLLYEKLENYME